MFQINPEKLSFTTLTYLMLCYEGSGRYSKTSITIQTEHRQSFLTFGLVIFNFCIKLTNRIKRILKEKCSSEVCSS